MSSSATTQGVILYISSVAGSVAVDKHTDRLKLLLDSAKVQYKELDIAQFAVEKNYMITNSKNKNPRTIPQVFREGKYVGDIESLEEANEDGEFKKLFE